MTMSKEQYEALTLMERNCLRLAHHERKTETIAHELGIRPSTVNTHIFSARRKLGGIPRLSAADGLRSYEALLSPSTPTELRRTLTGGEWRSAPAATQAVSRHTMPMVDGPAWPPETTSSSDVREQRAVFVFDDERLAASGGQDRSSDASLRRAALILAIAALTALVLIAAPAIYDSTAQRFANSLERPHAR